MSNQAYEILCPTCRSPLPADAAQCPSCSARTAQSAAAASAALPASPIETNAIAELGLKDYHRLVQVHHVVNEGYRTPVLSSPVLPALGLILLGVAVGVGFLLGWF